MSSPDELRKIESGTQQPDKMTLTLLSNVLNVYPDSCLLYTSPDGIKVSVWYNEEGISFRRGNGARKNPERLLSWEEAAERIEILYRNGQFTTRESVSYTHLTERTEIRHRR